MTGVQDINAVLMDAVMYGAKNPNSYQVNIEGKLAQWRGHMLVALMHVIDEQIDERTERRYGRQSWRFKGN